MNKFIVSEYEISSPKINATCKDPIKAVMLCDLHDKSYGRDNEELIHEIHEINPHFILVAGDLITVKKKNKLNNAFRLAKTLAKRYPVYYSNGNHESRLRDEGDRNLYDKYVDKLQRAGVCFLNNGQTQIYCKNTRIDIHGFDLDMRFYQKRNRYPFGVAELEEKLGSAGHDHYQILLAHNPVYFHSYARWGADLTLSGHLHGGIIRLPFIGGIISPQARIFPKYDRGIFARDEKLLIVGGGLGEHTVKIRFNNPPELISIRLKNE